MGQRFGRLVVIGEAENTKRGTARWMCLCDCGNRKVITSKCLIHEETKSCGCFQREVSKYKKMGDKNVNWKGNNVGYSALHGWVKRRLKKPGTCQFCNENKPLDLANKSQNYLRDLNDWLWLCKKCHVRQDGRFGKKKFSICQKCKKTFWLYARKLKFCSRDCYLDRLILCVNGRKCRKCCGCNKIKELKKDNFYQRKNKKWIFPCKNCMKEEAKR